MIQNYKIVQDVFLKKSMPILVDSNLYFNKSALYFLCHLPMRYPCVSLNRDVYLNP